MLSHPSQVLLRKSTLVARYSFTKNRLYYPKQSNPVWFLHEVATFCSSSYETQTVNNGWRSKLRSVWLSLFDTTLPTSKQYTILKLLGFYSKDSQAMAAAARLYTDLVKRTDDQNFGILKALEVPPSFLARFQGTALHFWLSLCRLRAVGQSSSGRKYLALPSPNDYQNPIPVTHTVFYEKRGGLTRECAKISQAAYDRFWQDMSRRLYYEEGLNSRQVSKYCSELEKIFFGASTLLDESARHAIAGDSGSSLREAIDKDWRPLATDGYRKLALEKYIRDCLLELQNVPDDVVLSGTMWLRIIMPKKMDMAIQLQNALKDKQ
eukprot:jgi/Galph1/3675/GphlegSOOS_G2376.1